MGMLPMITPAKKTQLVTYNFKGYNHNPVISDGEMYDQENMCADKYPLLSPRQRRLRFKLTDYVEDPHIICTLGGYLIIRAVFEAGEDEEYALCYFNGFLYLKLLTIKTRFFTANGYEYIYPKCMAMLGSDLFIYPTGLKFNTITDESAYVRKFSSGLPVSSLFTCDENGTITKTGHYTAVSCDNIHTDSEYSFIRHVNAGDKIHIQFDPDHIKQNDMRTAASETMKAEVMRMCAQELTIKKITLSPPGDIESIFIVFDWQVNTSKIDDWEGVYTQFGQASGDANYRMGYFFPDIERACEFRNRIWGYSYKAQADESRNEIYASALGDGGDFSLFEGTNADSWTASVGMPEYFTGCYSYRDNIYFFKPFGIIKVSGSNPSTFSVDSTYCDGPRYVGEVTASQSGIYYHTHDAVYRYDGTIPEKISGALDKFFTSSRFQRTYIASYGKKILMYISQGYWNTDPHPLFAYDTELGIWDLYDKDINIATFVEKSNETADQAFYENDGDDIYRVNIDEQVTVEEYENSDNPTWKSYCEPEIDWMATFGQSGYEFLDGMQGSFTNLPKQTYLSRYNIRMRLTEGSWVRMWIEYDSSGEWEDQGEIRYRPGMTTFMIPVIPRRCDHCRLKLTGHGRVDIYSIGREFEAGGDGGVL